MFDWLANVLGILAGYVLDFLVWLLEFVFWIFDALLHFLWGLIKPIIDSCWEVLSSHLPPDLISSIIASYEWLQYIGQWVPIQYGITLFVAYYSLASGLYIARVIISFFPVGRI